MGNVNAQSLARLQEEVQKGHFDAILHVGDFAYNLDTVILVFFSLRLLSFLNIYEIKTLNLQDNARVGDAFMNQIQSIAAYVPYMTCAGNHEQN